MSRILVTGGAGFIGSHTVDALINAGHDVIVIDNLSSGKKTHIHQSAHFYQMDIRDPALASIFKKHSPEFVYHFAAQINVRHSVSDSFNDANINILGSLNVLENARLSGVKKIIFSSTGGVMYGEARAIPTQETHPSYPTSPYAIAKRTMENYLQFYHNNYHLPFVAFRYANVYGPRQDNKGEAGVIAIFIEAITRGKIPTIYGDGSQTRDFIFIQDVVKANLSALESSKTSEAIAVESSRSKRSKGVFLQAPLIGIYNVSTAQETSIRELFHIIQRVLSFPHEAKYGDLPSGEVRRSALDFQKLYSENQWSPDFSLEQGIVKTCEWWKQIA
ncbi:NAD-dependent epimerase/dehydratase family protein [Candidatus Peregrinibacteria bacterium]|nr:NAD-dependent epimerase/dehydratase family protein [Candidatus Peregrinibacteria bacterium]